MTAAAAGYQHRWIHWCAHQPLQLAVRTCWCCGSPRGFTAVRGDLCVGCHQRWERNGFRGPGPGPHQKPAVADSVQEYAGVITSLSARRAAERLGVTPRTVQRWRARLREAS